MYNVSIIPGIQGSSDSSVDVGDITYTDQGDMLCWNGSTWNTVLANCTDNQDVTVKLHAEEMKEDFEKYPALKEAWNQYVLVYKMVKINE